MSSEFGVVRTDRNQSYRKKDTSNILSLRSGITSGTFLRAIPQEAKQVADGLRHIARETDHAINLATAPVRRAINPALTPRWERHFDGQFDRPYKQKLAGENVIVRLTIPHDIAIPQTVVFAHGFQQISRDSRAVQLALYQLGIPSASIEPGPHSIDRYAAITAEFMEHVAEKSDHDQVTLLPISMGGVYGSRALQLNPERVGSMLYVEPGGFDKQNPISLAMNTFTGGIKEAAAVVGDRHYKDAGVMLGGLVSAAHNIARHPIPALKQINAIATQHVNAIEAATHMRVVYGTPAALILMAEDGTFEQITMLGEVAKADEALQKDRKMSINTVFDIVKVVPNANHFTLSTRPETINSIAETVPELWSIQQQKSNVKKLGLL